MFSLTLATSTVIDGVCYTAVIWSSELAKAIHYIWSVISFYVIIILIIVFCYWRILAAIRRKQQSFCIFSVVFLVLVVSGRRLSEQCVFWSPFVVKQT